MIRPSDAGMFRAMGVTERKAVEIKSDQITTHRGFDSIQAVNICPEAREQGRLYEIRRGAETQAKRPSRPLEEKGFVRSSLS